MQTLYFAYGSNLSPERMRARVPSARALGPARLAGQRLTTDKPGRDGSGKANLRPDAGAEVWGALYAIDPAHWPELDRCEGGYARVPARVVGPDGGSRSAWTYRSELVADDPLPFTWYKQLMLDGARAHGLPREWIAFLEALPAQQDPAGVSAAASPGGARRR
jgi:gamma-glutamylcyclotransferase (GGCT)/AIG2-like uncharacterized protein YtfP